MTFDFSIEINMEDFIKNGKFDCIQLGQTKELILNNFPDPDGHFSMSYKDNIWLYGTFEFHFTENKLWLIFCEDLSLRAGNSIKINKWIFDKPPFILSKIVRILNNEHIDYQLTHVKNLSQIVILIITSKVELVFDSDGEKDCNKYRLFAFGLSAVQLPNTSTRLDTLM